MRIRVFLKPETVLRLLAKRDKPESGVTWLAVRLRVSKTLATRMVRGSSPVPDGFQARIYDAFRGMGLEGSRRVSWDDLFKVELYDSTGAV